jgi:BirA family biotin operon repressor/biotin-[acetyl-CoA-carboxylase] ligase
MAKNGPLVNIKTLSILNPFGAPVYYRDTVSSTMDESRGLAASGAPHGTVMCAGFQERGRGRGQNRPWNMNREESLPFTILLRYADFSAVPAAITLRTGLAVAEALEDFAPPLKDRIQVKWPNDIMILGLAAANPGRKLAGILTEGDGRTVYIGVGVNVAQTGFSAELRNKAASLALVLPESPEVLAASRFDLLEKILARLHRELGEGPGQADWRSRLDKRLFMKDQPVSFIAGGVDSKTLVEGRLLGIGGEGEILIATDGEQVLPFVTGELRVY